jgi:hypothetical protein
MAATDPERLLDAEIHARGETSHQVAAMAMAVISSAMKLDEQKLLQRS